MTKTFGMAVAAVLTLTLGGCGSSAEDDATASRAIADSLIEAQETNSSQMQLFTWKREEADCVGKGLVKEIGTEQLQDYGLLDDELEARSTITGVKMNAEDAASATDVVFGCADVPAMVKGELSQNDDLPARTQKCIAKVMTVATLRPLFEQTFQGNQEAATAALTEPLSECALGENR